MSFDTTLMTGFIKENYEDFLESSQKRCDTSIGNKELHYAMIIALTVKDWQHVEELLLDPWYHKPLQGVILCMNSDSTVIGQMLELLGEVY